MLNHSENRKWVPIGKGYTESRKVRHRQDGDGGGGKPGRVEPNPASKILHQSENRKWVPIPKGL